VIKLLLVVSALGSGGPVGACVPGCPLSNVTIVLRSHGRPIAKSTNGRLVHRVAPGSYRLESWGRFSSNGSVPCESRTIRITRTSGRRAISLFCQIK